MLIQVDYLFPPAVFLPRFLRFFSLLLTSIFGREFVLILFSLFSLFSLFPLLYLQCSLFYFILFDIFFFDEGDLVGDTS